MPAYLIVDLDIEEVGALDEYRRRAVPILAKYGGRAIMRLGTVTVLEGDWRPKRMVGIEFPTMAALQRDDWAGPGNSTFTGTYLR